MIIGCAIQEPPVANTERFKQEAGTSTSADKKEEVN